MTTTPSPRRQTLADLLRRTRLRYPAKTAIRCGTVSWTYAELDDTCTRLARGLAAQGVAAGDRVAVLARNSHAFVALRFAVARLGAVLVPINFMLNAEEVRYILDHSGASLLAMDSLSGAVAREAATGTAVRQQVWLPGEDASEPVPGLPTFDALLLDGPALPEPALDPDALAQIIYTSAPSRGPRAPCSRTRP